MSHPSSSSSSSSFSSASSMFNRFDVYTNTNVNVDVFSPPENATPEHKKTYTCFKLLLMCANLLFIILGIVLVGVGAYALKNQVAVLQGVTLPGGLIAMGVFMIVLSALGAISAWRESKSGLVVYLVFLLLISIMTLSIGIAVYVKRSEAPLYIAEAWLSAPGPVRCSLQNVFVCCGLTLFNDTDAGRPCPDVFVPYSTSYVASTPKIACLIPMSSAFYSSFSTAGSCGIAFAVIMFVDIVIVCCLIDGIKKYRAEQLVAEMAETMQSDFRAGVLEHESVIQNDERVPGVYVP